MSFGSGLANIDVPFQTNTPRVPPKVKRKGYVSFHPILHVKNYRFKKSLENAASDEKNSGGPRSEHVQTDGEEPYLPVHSAMNFRFFMVMAELHPQVCHRDHAWIIVNTSAAAALLGTMTDFVAYWRRLPPLSTRSTSTALSLSSDFSPTLSHRSAFPGAPTPAVINTIPTTSLTSSQKAARQTRNEQPHRLISPRTAAEWHYGCQTHLAYVAPGHFCRSFLWFTSELSLYAVFREQLRLLLAIGSSGQYLTSPYRLLLPDISSRVEPPSSAHASSECRTSVTGGERTKLVTRTSFAFQFMSHLCHANLWCGVGGGALAGALCTAVAHPYHVLETTVRMECVRVPSPAWHCSSQTGCSRNSGSSDCRLGSGASGRTQIRRRFRHVGEVLWEALRPTPTSSLSSTSSFRGRCRKLLVGLRQGRRIAVVGGALQGGVQFGSYELLREDGMYRHSAVLFLYCWLASFAGVVCQYPCKTLRQLWFSAAALPSLAAAKGKNGPSERKGSRGGEGAGFHPGVTYRSVLQELRRTGGVSRLWLHFFSFRPMLCALPGALLLYGYDCLMQQAVTKKSTPQTFCENDGPMQLAESNGTSVANRFTLPQSALPSRVASAEQSLTAIKMASAPLPPYEFPSPSKRKTS